MSVVEGRGEGGGGGWGLFFFSSRRRHTRFTSDWSSDVCSSDLGEGYIGIEGFEAILGEPAFSEVPFFLEVPGFEGDGPDEENMNRLKSIRSKLLKD